MACQPNNFLRPGLGAETYNYCVYLAGGIDVAEVEAGAGARAEVVVEAETVEAEAHDDTIRALGHQGSFTEWFLFFVLRTTVGGVATFLC